MPEKQGTCEDCRRLMGYSKNPEDPGGDFLVHCSGYGFDKPHPEKTEDECEHYELHENAL